MAGIGVLDGTSKLAHLGRGMLMDQGVFRDSASGSLPRRDVEAAPGQIRRLVYLTAYVPVPGLPNGAALASLPEGRSFISGAILTGDPRVTGAQRINPHDPDPAPIEKGRRARYNHVPTEEYLTFAVHCKPHLPVAAIFDDTHGTPQRWMTTPRAFIRCTQDHTVPLALQDRMIKEADEATPGNSFEVHTLASSHSSLASMPGKLAMVLTGPPPEEGAR